MIRKYKNSKCKKSGFCLYSLANHTARRGVSDRFEFSKTINAINVPKRSWAIKYNKNRYFDEKGGESAMWFFGGD